MTKTHKRKKKLCLLAALMLIVVTSAQAQTVLTADQLQNGQAVELDKLGWKYSPNDDPRFAEPQFDDSAWETLASSAKPEDSKSGWHGIGWFRLHLRVAPELANKALNLEMAQLGASEVYVNGQLIRRFGVVGKTLAEETAYNPNALPLGIVLQAGAEQVVAVRYSNQQAADVNSFLAWQILRAGENSLSPIALGVRIRVREFGAAASQSRMGYAGWPFPFSFMATVITIFLSFGVLHLLLFAFFAHRQSNLFYGLYLLGSGINYVFLFVLLSGHDGLTGRYLLFWGAAITAHFPLVALLGFLYSAFTPGLPRRMWFFLAGAFVPAFWGMVWPVKYWTLPAYLFSAVVTLEMLRVMIDAIRRQLPGVWIVGTGLLLYSVTLVQFFMTTPNLLTYGLGIFGMIFSLSIYLAQEYANTNKSLEAQLVQVKQLSAAALEHEKVKAENERRAAELEEARQLQLSMLPKKLPQLPHLDIAAYMKTATEVGGDYYDFHLGEDGTLTIAVGDATGHGLKAGTLVSSVKSLFVSLAYHPDIPHIFHRISTVLKEMKLRGLFMAMTMVKVKGNQMTVSIAGMPSVLIYRAAANQVEEVAMRALPLGGMTKYQYQQQEFRLAVNDVVVLMSDGLPERFNVNGEMLEDVRIHQALPTLAQQSAEEIIAALVRLGDEWGAGHPQDDDVTFVVLRIK